MPFKNVLLAFDGSKQAKKALMKTIQLMKQTEGKVNVLYVYQNHIRVPASYAAHLNEADYASFNKMEVERGQHILDEAKDQLMMEDIDHALILVEGSPAHRIHKEAQTQECDLIVMGSHGYGPLKEFMLGSVSHKVTQISTIPILIVK
ncbi:universal stress protein [Caldalkalibacillus mannanilyticus]|uniref:universal stress protein n=1 Tax=Caldalkalibacillus mannanilyticus TaxID=1418 RepID=UPI0004695480|nr:universal stress protein [Caldalkalibacillus mannanilyticus]